MKNRLDVAGRVALVTGASSGIGFASAQALAENGATVIGVDIRSERNEEAMAAVAKLGQPTLALSADISRDEQMAEVYRQTVARFGRLDIVVASAGVNGMWAPLEELTAEEWDRTLSINLRGTFLTLKYAIPHLRAAGGGSVVVISSINGPEIKTTAGSTAYACSKTAQLTLVQKAALELARWKIRVNAVQPGTVNTSLIEETQFRNLDKIRLPIEYHGSYHLLSGRRAEAPEIADAVLFLASNASRHITGSSLVVDGGESLVMG